MTDRLELAPGFEAPWGRLLKLTSALVTLILLLIPVAGAAALPSSAPGWVSWMMLLIGPATLGLMLLYVVQGYTVTPEALLIRRLLWTTRLPLAGLKGVEFRPQVMRGSIRLFGNGGAFVFAGWFRNKELGLYRSYVNDLDRTVVLKLSARTVVVSPRDPDAFVAAVRRAAPWLEPGPPA